MFEITQLAQPIVKQTVLELTHYRVIRIEDVIEDKKLYAVVELTFSDDRKVNKLVLVLDTDTYTTEWTNQQVIEAVEQSLPNI